MSSKFFVVSSLSHNRTGCWWSSLGAHWNCRKLCVQYLTLKSVSFHRGESYSSILLSDLERIIFALSVGSILLNPSLTQSAGDGQAIIDLFPHSPTLNAVNIITSKLLQMESNGDQWLKEQVLFFYKKWLLGVWHFYSCMHGQMWLRWPSDQPLVSPYSASRLSVKPVMRILLR